MKKNSAHFNHHFNQRAAFLAQTGEQTGDSFKLGTIFLKSGRNRAIALYFILQKGAKKELKIIRSAAV